MDTPNLPLDVIYILNTLNAAGFEAYIVGGCVRDTLLAIHPKDWDITTAATPAETKSLFSHTFDTGIQHGTITVVLHKTNYEITTYRVDGDYGDCRHPTAVSFTKNLEQDLLRRDFTMNAIAYHPLEGYLDPFGGQGDIQHRIIRGVGNPALRFQEDALRMLRGLRFAAQLGFTIEPQTYDALCAHVHLIQKISAERIRIELEKLWLSQDTQKMPLLWESGLLDQIHPQLASLLGDKRETLLGQLAVAPKKPAFCWALVLHGLEATEVRTFLRRLKFDNETLWQVELLLSHSKNPLPLDAYGVRVLAGTIGAESLSSLIAFCAILTPTAPWERCQSLLEEILAKGDCLTLHDLAFDGKALMALGVPKGKEVGRILNLLLDHVRKDPAKNTVDALTEIYNALTFENQGKNHCGMLHYKSFLLVEKNHPWQK